MRVMSVRAKPIIAESYRHHGHQKHREIPFTRERSKVRSLVRPPLRPAVERRLSGPLRPAPRRTWPFLQRRTQHKNGSIRVDVGHAMIAAFVDVNDVITERHLPLITELTLVEGWVTAR
jgi:hypothetical protein